MSGKRSEATEQMAFMNLVNFGLPAETAALVFHIPNGERRDARTAIKLRKMGVKAGVPDILVALPRPPYAGLFIEMKPEKGGRVDKAQVETHNMLRRQGYAVSVCRGAKDAFATLEQYLDGQEIQTG